MCDKHDDHNKARSNDKMSDESSIEDNAPLSRRKFIQQSVVLGAGLILTGASPLFAAMNPTKTSHGNIKSRGYAAVDTSGKLQPWAFERRPVGDDDVLIDIKYASICHSDIHQMKGHWGPQQYPQVPGHEIVGVVAAVGKNVTKFKVGDRAGVGCMVDSNPECESYSRMKSSTVLIPPSPMVILKKAPRPEFHRVATRPISL